MKKRYARCFRSELLWASPMMDLAVEKQTIGIIPYFVFCPTLNTVLDKVPLPQPLAMIRETDQKMRCGEKG